MKIVSCTLIVAVLAAVDCYHTFLGGNVNRTLVYHYNVHYLSLGVMMKRMENLSYKLPNVTSWNGRTIQGILAYDLTDTGATANITDGGIGFKFMNIRMESNRGMDIHYDIYAYI